LAHSQGIQKVKVKAFMDESITDHTNFVISSVTTADNGAIVGFYPTLDGQPDWIEEKKGETTKAGVHTWSREKILHQVDKSPYLVYGRDQVDPLSLMRFNDKTYLLGYQQRSSGGSAIVHSILEGSGITPSPCNELFSGDMLMDLKERSGNELVRRASTGIRAIESGSGEHILLAMIGKITQGAKEGPVSLLLLDKELNKVWNETLFLSDGDKGAGVLDVMLQGDSTIYVLVAKDSKAKDGGMTRELRLYQRGNGIKNHQVMDLEEHYAQDARMALDAEGNVRIAGIYGKTGARQDETFGAFTLTVSSEDLSSLSLDKQAFDDPEDQGYLAGVDYTSDGRCFITTASYVFEGIKAGSGGSELKNITYHCNKIRVFHCDADGSIAKTTVIQMANAGKSALEVMPVAMMFNDELMLFYNDDPENADKRKKGGELDPEKAKSDVGAQYTQLNFAGEQYSRPFLKEDDVVRSIFPMNRWVIDSGELFLLGVIDGKYPEYHPIKIQITAAN
jgi:hypothetical protein